MVAAGMPAMDTLAAATVHAADLCGLSEELGTLAPGKAADVVAFARNPLKDIDAISEVALVMRAGAIFRD